MKKSLKKVIQKKLAFSLIEMTVVILIISILTMTFLKTDDLLLSFKKNKAASLTKSSPIRSISNLVLWFETTSAQSFDQEKTTDGNPIDTWNNINPYQNQTTPNYATQNTTDSQPIYIKNAINGLPVLRFDGANDYLSYNGTALANSNYSIFVVEQRRSGKNGNYFIGGSGSADNTNLLLGYRFNSTITHAQYNNDYDVSIIPTYSSPIPRIHSFRFSSSIGKDYSLNGVIKSNYNNNVGLLSYNGTVIGSALNLFFNGDIGEIIIFNKYLNDSEKRVVEEYLSNKWKIEF